MQQIENAWRSTANLDLLLGTHPPNRLEKPILRANDAASAAMVPLIDARNTVEYGSASYGGAQDLTSSRCRKLLVNYYREMLSKVSLWSAMEAAMVKKEAAPSGVKAEQEDADDGDAPAMAPPTLAGRGGSTFRALGIITQTPDPSTVGEALLTPWEFYMIADLEDDSLYLPALRAMTKEVSMSGFSFLHAAGETGTADKKTSNDGAGSSPDPTQEEHRGGEQQRVSLFTKLLDTFTGVYPGMAVGVIGEPFQRDARGVLSGVLVRQLVLPHRPRLPWQLAAPVPQAALLAPRPTRVHFCSGPFPFRDITSVLKAVVRQALHRGADVLIIGGPLISLTDTPDMEKDLLLNMGDTFEDFLNRVYEALTEQLASHYELHPLVPHMKIIFVSHRTDVTQIPVLPTTMYALQDDKDVWVRSNPMRIAVNGVHFGVCNEDVVDRMRRVMVERWPTAEGRLRRTVESLVQSRYYTPLLELPAAAVDLKYMERLRLDYLPQVDIANALPTHVEENWDKVFSGATKAAEDSVKGEEDAAPKRAKVETKTENDGVDVKTVPADERVESLPHILFLPSKVPKFSVVTHRAVPSGASSRAGGAHHLTDESPVDDVDHATGVLVVNQGVWSKRGGGKFEMHVAEVTIENSEVVARRGASAATGVACGVLHIYNNPI